jgi:hypothetical protein
LEGGQMNLLDIWIAERKELFAKEGWKTVFIDITNTNEQRILNSLGGY